MAVECGIIKVEHVNGIPIETVGTQTARGMGLTPRTEVQRVESPDRRVVRRGAPADQARSRPARTR